MTPARIRFDEQGLVPVVAQEARDGRILMLAYANREAVEATVASGFAHYYSRSRAALWKKGETSGNVQRVVDVRIDCDGDALTYVVESAGPACHTGQPTCFFAALDGSARPETAGAGVLAALGAVIESRRQAAGERSYVRRLLEAGAAAIAAKVEEE